VLGGCGGGGGSDEIQTTFDACAPISVKLIGASPIQTAGADDALASWRGHGVTAFDPPGAVDATSIEIRFDSAAPQFHGLYDDVSGIVYVNQGISSRAALAVVIAHELGHAFGLLHVDADDRASLMNPGNLETPPTREDELAVEALWGRCK